MGLNDKKEIGLLVSFAGTDEREQRYNCDTIRTFAAPKCQRSTL
jgi:hypothetical protein